MRPPSFFVLAVILILIVAVLLVRGTSRNPPRTTAKPPDPILRRPAVAGTFYPSDAGQLRSQLDTYLKRASAPKPAGELVALIVPHAGYVYSAPVAAYAYRQLQGKHYDTVVVIGPSHRVPFPGLALSEADSWSTPLGPVPVDRVACQALLKADPSAQLNEGAHAAEHSIEVQLPFLEVLLQDFKLLPVLMMDFSQQNCSAAAKALAGYARGRSVLLIASSDMSHYPSYDDAVRVDHEMLKAIKSMDAERVAAVSRELMGKGTPNLSTCLCGEGPVKTVLMAARLLGADKVSVLRYANSGDIRGSPRDRVVGYGALAIYGSKETPTVKRPTEHEAVNPAQQQRLLTVARAAIEAHVRAGQTLELEEKDPLLLRPAAAFVTLRQQGQLRGCIGSLQPDAPLVETVRRRAIHAAVEDPRFPPVSPAELPSLEIEISVLSPLRKVASAEEIDISKHGVVVESGSRRGVFLPQVAQETGWDRNTLLSHLCQDKAGLPPDAWKQAASLYVFTVQAFTSPAPEH